MSWTTTPPGRLPVPPVTCSLSSSLRSPIAAYVHRTWFDKLAEGSSTAPAIRAAPRPPPSHYRAGPLPGRQLRQPNTHRLRYRSRDHICGAALLSGSVGVAANHGLAGHGHPGIRSLPAANAQSADDVLVSLQVSHALSYILAFRSVKPDRDGDPEAPGLASLMP